MPYICSNTHAKHAKKVKNFFGSKISYLHMMLFFLKNINNFIVTNYVIILTKNGKVLPF